MPAHIDKLIINNPYHEPTKYWLYERENRNFSIKSGRRPAGYVVATSSSQSFDDPGIFVEIDLVNQIRPRVKKWKENGYPGVTGITRRLLDHWQDPNERQERKFFFCQLEAIETLIWLTEAPGSDKVGIEVKGDGGDFQRWCNKMATGSGKTIIMSMIISWNFLNKVTNPKDVRFSKHALIIAPGLTVKNRLEVLLPSNENNYYKEFNIVPHSLMDKLRQGKVIIHNWHTLSWDTQDKIDDKIKKGSLRSVDKRKTKEISGEAYVKQVLGDISNAKNIIVINDEAHHAWRVNSEAVGKYQRAGSDKDSAEEATVWVGGLDRIHKQRGILKCFDLSATPFSPSGKKTAEESLFPWIVSDFGLNDAIESGLVKTPRVVIRDDSVSTAELKSRLYHIYQDSEVRDDINRKAQETEPLPDLLINAYNLLGADWLETKKSWEKTGQKTPPVMITVANRTETSSRIKYAFDNNQILIKELCNPERTLQIDSNVLKKAEIQNNGMDADFLHSQIEVKLTQDQQIEHLRLMVDTVGKEGKPGEKIQNVISVGMLSEGWDAQTVTHIMGLRAFSSQLLCEQVIGRGLRRVSYDAGADGLFEAEYVNIFGVPFTFLPHEGGEGLPPPPPKPKTKIEPVREKSQHEIIIPNVIRIDHVYKTHLELDWDNVQTLTIEPNEAITEAQMAAIISGKPNEKLQSLIGLDKIAKDTRLQTIVFKVAAAIYNIEKANIYWSGAKEIFLAQVTKLTNSFLESNKILFGSSSVNSDENVKKIHLILNMSKIIQHVWAQIKVNNVDELTAVFDTEKPILSTADIRTWFTSKPCEWLNKSHINFCVYDSDWETSEARFLDKSNLVKSFVKNDHLGFYVAYNYKGVIRKYFPDFIIQLSNGDNLILEVKGEDSDQNKTKREYLNEWVMAINNHGGFGMWHWLVSFNPNDIEDKIKELLAS